MGERRPHPLVELTRMRVLEGLREPEALFWGFVFPVLMVCALGLAFRAAGAATDPDRGRAGPGGRRTRPGAGLGCAAGRARSVGAGDVERLLRNGTVHLVIVPGADADLPLRPRAPRDPARAARRRPGPAAGPRAHRRVHASRRHRGAGGLALRRLAGAGPAGHEHHGQRDVGHRLRHRAGPHEEAAEAVGRHADAPARLPAVVSCLARDLRCCWRHSPSSASACWCSARPSTATSSRLEASASWAWRPSGAWACWSRAVRRPSKRCPAG